MQQSRNQPGIGAAALEFAILTQSAQAKSEAHCGRKSILQKDYG